MIRTVFHSFDIHAGKANTPDIRARKRTSRNGARSRAPNQWPRRNISDARVTVTTRLVSTGLNCRDWSRCSFAIFQTNSARRNLCSAFQSWNETERCTGNSKSPLCGLDRSESRGLNVLILPWSSDRDARIYIFMNVVWTNVYYTLNVLYNSCTKHCMHLYIFEVFIKVNRRVILLLDCFKNK